ncbi:hypothetical protein ACKWTF_012476 [Chironomus riparius]
MNLSSLLHSILIAACLCLVIVNVTFAGSIHGINRFKCENRNAIQRFQNEKEVAEKRNRIEVLRNEMRIRSSQSHEIDAYIVTTYDEHHNHLDDDAEGRLEYISGFTGPIAYAAITSKSAGLWTESKYFELADRELDCGWKIFDIADDPTISMWLGKQVPENSYVGADPKAIPHQLWFEWERDLNREFLSMSKVKNLIDTIGGSSVASPRDFKIRTQNSTFSGLSWHNKTEALRETLRAHRFDAMVVTSLTEIAYLLNLRGGDFRYVPVFKAYLIVTHREIVLYTNRTKVSIEAELMMNFDFKTNSCFKQKCVIIKHYNDIWKDLRILSTSWNRVLMPSMNNFDLGVSEAIYSSVNREIIHERTSPIVYMRAQKNKVEREGMRHANIRDAVALCDTLSYLEERYMHGDQWTESLLAQQIDRPRHEQNLNRGLSFKTIIAFGKNAAKEYYYPTNYSDAEITNTNLLLIDSGGQYLDGTTSIARTIHLGVPTAEHKRAYTNVLMGMIRLSMLAFPEDLKPSEIDALIREPLWTAKQDYPHLSGYGIGSYLSVEESPIYISYTTKHKYALKDGYFFTVAPGYYKPNEFGVRVKNVFEVVNSDRKGFLEIRVISLVPFETKLIDKTMLSLNEKKWLNQYNARIREVVGDELKRQFKMPAFYWLMNHTEHIREYLTEDEYRKSSSYRLQFNLNYLLILTLILRLKSFIH